jgi:hypothetical protein
MPHIHKVKRLHHTYRHGAHVMIVREFFKYKFIEIHVPFRITGQAISLMKSFLIEHLNISNISIIH